MLIRGDARSLPLRDGSVDTVVTSPPYWGLRNYQHEGQIGLESTPDSYVQQIVAVFREVRRVLKVSGTVWLNLGDSFSSGTRTTQCAPTLRRLGHDEASGKQGYLNNFSVRPGAVEGLKPKDLVGIPWRVAFALQADGWYLRSDIIWSKPNPMPESVTDRPTKAHEYLFLLSKSERYYYDAQAIAEPCSLAMLDEVEQGYDGLGLKDYESAGVQNPSSVKARIIKGAQQKQARTPGKSDRKSTRLNSSHIQKSRMPSSA